MMISWFLWFFLVGSILHESYSSPIVTINGDGTKTYSILLSWKGGNPRCSNCGPPGGYACSPPTIGLWNDGIQTFQDPSYRDGVLQNVTAEVSGSWSCQSNAASTIELLLQDSPIDSFQVVDNKYCACNSCSSKATFTNTLYYAGWPNYNYFSQNKLQVKVIDNQICISSIRLNLTFGQPFTNKVIYTTAMSSKLDSNCTVCNGPKGNYACSSTSNWNQGKFYFDDVIPKGNVLTTVTASVYGFYLFSGSRTLSLSLGSATIGRKTVYGTHGSQTNYCDACDGGIDYISDNVYQAGWPGYVYGQKNYVQVSLDYYSFCINEIVLALEYYPRQMLSYDLLNRMS